MESMHEAKDLMAKTKSDVTWYHDQGATDSSAAHADWEKASIATFKDSLTKI